MLLVKILFLLLLLLFLGLLLVIPLQLTLKLCLDRHRTLYLTTCNFLLFLFLLLLELMLFLLQSGLLLLAPWVCQKREGVLRLLRASGWLPLLLLQGGLLLLLHLLQGGLLLLLLVLLQSGLHRLQAPRLLKLVCVSVPLHAAFQLRLERHCALNLIECALLLFGTANEVAPPQHRVSLRMGCFTPGRLVARWCKGV